jgi:hypothetical protein
MSAKRLAKVDFMAHSRVNVSVSDSCSHGSRRIDAGSCESV